MSKIIEQTNVRLEVEPDLGWSTKTVEQQKLICRNIAEQIRRHVDDVKHVSIRWDTKELCEYCKLGWETLQNGEPVCCDLAAQEWREERKQI